VHARRAGRDHLMVWFGALVAGTANDFIFMALPLVDNFWQAQATLMLTPRMPVYIPCVYVCFLYYPTVAVRRLGLGIWPTAALTGLCAMLFYAPYDIVGAKFLWWSWHDTDTPIRARILGAPTSSSLWVLTFAGSFSWLIARVLRDVPRPEQADISGRTLGTGLVLVAAFSTLVMMVQMTVLQQLDGGAPGYIALATGALIYAIVGVRALRRDGEQRPATAASLPRAMVVVHFLTLAAIMAAFDPTTHVSTGIHQPPGKCYVEATDITGNTRHEFLCAADYDEDYDFHCAAGPPADGAEWYTICGRAHGSRLANVGGVGGLGAVGIAVFAMLFGARREV